VKREEAEELRKLSLKCFGKPYEWQKLRRKGLVLGHDKETGYIRRMPLTVEQTRDYMIKTLEMREKIDADRRQSNGKSQQGQTEARDSSGDDNK
jgi:hypothetical protein